MILVADKAAVESVVSPTPGEKPWIWAIDVTFPFESGEQPLGDPPTDHYSGHFRVAYPQAVTELWPMLMGPRMPGCDLWRLDQKVWEHWLCDYGRAEIEGFI